MSTTELPRLGNGSQRVRRCENGIQSHHLERLAVVYVRQSTPRQVIENRESTELQYRLVDRAIELGWRRDRVLVIDDDLGQSGSTADHRVGFQRLMAEVGMNHVGLVLGIEMSRLARSCKDWHQLLELCSVFRTLLADHDRQYDPCDYSDRLLLGLSGIMSEAELHILRMRMERGRQNKAKRGELLSHVPIGYVRSPSGEVALDPDEQARSVVRLIFETFVEVGSGRQLMRYLLDHEILLPVRPHHGPNQGQLEWHPPSGATLYGMLRHPGYAGAYSFGRSRIDPRRKKPGRPGTGQVRVPMDQWQALLLEKWPAYISWEQFLANQERLRSNRAAFETLGAPREGSALLGGLTRCGKCGWRMYVDYKKAARYVCGHDAALAGHCEGQNLVACVVDELVGHQVLLAVEPAAVELSLKAEEDCRQEYQRLSEHWQQKLERVRYKTERARRQYDAVEPENRLVARELERIWEQALIEEQKAKEESARFETEWFSGTSEQERETIHWAGGFVSQHQIVRPVGRYEQLRDYDRLVARLGELRALGYTNGEIADLLNHEGFHTPKCDQKFDAPLVNRLASRCGLVRRRMSSGNKNALEKHEWSMSDLASKVGVPYSTLRNWCYNGWIRTCCVASSGRGRVVWADEHEIDRLRRLRGHPHPSPNAPYPSALTTPKAPAEE